MFLCEREDILSVKQRSGRVGVVSFLLAQGRIWESSVQICSSYVPKSSLLPVVDIAKNLLQQKNNAFLLY